MLSSPVRLPTAVSGDPELRVIPGCSFPHPHQRWHTACDLESDVCALTIVTWYCPRGVVAEENQSQPPLSMKSESFSPLEKKKGKRKNKESLLAETVTQAMVC